MFFFARLKISNIEVILKDRNLKKKASKLITVIEKKKSEILKIKFSRFGSGRFGSASMWLDVTYSIYSLFFQESFLFKSVKTNAAYSVVQSPITLYY